jgi:hypothetical protein
LRGDGIEPKPPPVDVEFMAAKEGEFSFTGERGRSRGKILFK